MKGNVNNIRNKIFKIGTVVINKVNNPKKIKSTKKVLKESQGLNWL